MTIAEKLQTIAENEQKVYDAGYTEGYNNGTMPIYHLQRFEFAWVSVIFPENTELVIRVAKAPKSQNACFLNTTNIKTLKMISEDNSNIVDLSQFVRGSADLELLDLTEYNRNISNIFYFMYATKKLKTILGALDLTNCTNVTNAFVAENGVLEDIEFVPNTINLSISFQYLKKLTKASITSIIRGLNRTEGREATTLTLSSAAVEGAFPGASSNDGFGNSDFNDLCAEPRTYNWTISLV